MTAAARILLVEVNEDGTAGGSHQCLFDIARSLDRTRYTPVALFYQNNRFAERLSALGIRTLIWEKERAQETPRRPPLRRLKQIVGLGLAVRRRLQLLQSERIDLVHMNNAPAIGYHDWFPAAKLSGIPILTHARLQFRMPRGAWRWLMRSFDAVIAISQEIERFSLAQGIPAERITQIYDGIDVAALHASIQRIPEEVREELGVAPEDILVAMVGHLRTWKGQDLALDALHRIAPPLRERLKLVFVGGVGLGDEPYFDSLRDTVSRHGLQSSVTFVGERSDAAAIMQAADIVLHASTRPEPFGLVVVEGMALGRAVIASGIGGPAEIITPGTGILFDPTRPDELATALATLAADPENRRRLGEAGQRRASDFSVEQNVEAIQALYGSLLRRQGRARAPAMAPSAAR